MQSQQATSGLFTPFLENGAGILRVSASAVMLDSTDVIKATGGAGGITLTLTPAIDPTGDPTNPTYLYQVYYAKKDDAAAGAITFVDPNNALFNGQPSWQLTNQHQWAIFIWNGVGWDVMGN
jgi:hypothetical protein